MRVAPPGDWGTPTVRADGVSGICKRGLLLKESEEALGKGAHFGLAAVSEVGLEGRVS